MRNRLLICCLAVAAALTACPAAVEPCVTGDEDSCDAGTLPPDGCDSVDQAKVDAQCQLTAGQRVSAYISTLGDGGADQDWYLFTTPASMGPRSLLHVNAGYGADTPQTAVNFRVNVLEKGTKSLATGLDKHGAAAPKPVDLVLPYATPNEQIFLLVGDEGGQAVPRVDNRTPYTVMAEVIDNPDVNEPNDTTATAIPLADSGGIAQGSQSGYLATNDDVDLYSFSVSGGARQVIYLHLSSTKELMPPPPFKLAYTLLDPDQVPIAEGRMANEFLKVDLSTARLATKAGTYTVKVQGYRPPGTTGAIGGDLRLQYSVEVRVMPDLDVNEPNDTVAQARPKTLALGSGVQLKGRLSTIPDEEWFSLELPATSQPSVLRYRFTAGTGAGRFPSTSLTPARQLRLTREVTQGATLQDRLVACKSDATVCPKSFEGNVGQQQLVESLCQLTDPPQCLWAERNEASQFARQKNLAGSIPVAAHGSTVRYLLLFRDPGLGNAKFADDVEYTLDVSWEAEPQPTASPVALGAGTTTVSGTLAYGYGRVADPLDINSGDGIRGPEDYDAVPTDLDSFTFTLPATTDQSWSLSWDVMPPDGGTVAPGQAYLEFVFCDASGGSCRDVKRVMSYLPGPATPWYRTQSFSNATTLFTQTTSGTTTTVTALPVGCWCVPQAYAAHGSLGVNVGAFNRVGHEPLRYALRQSVGAYPQSYPSDGGTALCPSAPDAGCGFGL